MPDTPMTDKERREKFLDWLQRLLILRRIDEGEYHEVDYAFDDAQCLVRYFRSLHARLDQAHWDAISRDQTIESLRAENARYREALEWYADHTIYVLAFANGGDDLDSHGMKSLAGIDSGNRARVALAALNGDSND